jgi:hypothetical protein
MNDVAPSDLAHEGELDAPAPLQDTLADGLPQKDSAIFSGSASIGTFPNPFTCCHNYGGVAKTDLNSLMYAGGRHWFF